MPPFSSREYWDARFSNDNSSFDWLVPLPTLCHVATKTLEETGVESPQILHIGCGTSEVSTLRSLVDDPRQILNVDFSDPAIDAVMVREQELLDHEQELLLIEKDHNDEFQPHPLHCMRYSCLDLMSLESTYSMLEHQSTVGKLFDLVLDKSTSDSIATGYDVRLTLPYPLSINGWTGQILQTGISQPAWIHRLHILAVHLAALTTPRTGRWMVVSYSEDRFPFLPPYPPSAERGLLTDEILKAGFPHPNQLWTLVKKERIGQDPEREETLAERKRRLVMGLTQRPKVSHWLYVLARTDAVVRD